MGLDEAIKEWEKLRGQEIHPVLRSIAQVFYEELINRSGNIHVTDVLTCLRQSYYAKLYPEKVAVAQLKRGILFGIALHDWLLQKLHEAGYISLAEIPIVGLAYPLEKGLYDHIHARIDAIMPDDVILELKSISRIPKEVPLKHHEKQVKAYMTCYPATNVAKILYVARTAFSKLIEEVEVKATDKELREVANWLRQRAHLLHQALQKREPPEPNIPEEIIEEAMKELQEEREKRRENARRCITVLKSILAIEDYEKRMEAYSSFMKLMRGKSLYWNGQSIWVCEYCPFGRNGWNICDKWKDYFLPPDEEDKKLREEIERLRAQIKGRDFSNALGHTHESIT